MRGPALPESKRAKPQAGSGPNSELAQLRISGASPRTVRLLLRSTRFVAWIAAAGLFAAPLSATASAAAGSQTHARMTAAQLASLRAQELPFAGLANPTRPIKLLVHLPMRNKAQALALAAQLATPHSSVYHKWLTPSQFQQRFGPLQSDMTSAAASLRAAGFTVTKVGIQNIDVTAPAVTVNRTFNTQMGLVRDGSVLKVDARAPYSLPAFLLKLNAKVVGLQAVHFHADHKVLGSVTSAPLAKKTLLHSQALNGGLGPYYPGELLQAYGEPSYTYGNGTGMHIAIVGNSDSYDSDNQSLWCSYGLGSGCGANNGAYPVVNHLHFTGYTPPGTDQDSVEATLDAQMAGGSAPGATIDQFAADASSATGFLDAYDYIEIFNTDDIVTTSYSYCELYYTFGLTAFSQLQAYDDAFVQGSLQGITFLFSSGDNGAYGCTYADDYTDLATSAFAADPNVTGVGGTTQFITTYFDNGLGTGYGAESSVSAGTPGTASQWGSGGGYSLLFETPEFQTAIGQSTGTINSTYGAPYGTGRVVPDISMHMGGPGLPFTSDLIVYTGGYYAVTGTSASSPELAGWIAEAVTAINASLGASGGFRVGNINNVFYYEQAIGEGPTIYNQDIVGDNIGYSYDPHYPSPLSYNPVIGLGTPKFAALMGILGLGGSYQYAGDLTSNSNP